MTEDVLPKFKRRIESWTMIPSDCGRFEVVADGKLLYSKLATRQFPSNEEVIALIEKALAKK